METVTRLRAGTANDGYGDPQPSWTTPSSLTLSARGVEPTSSTEDNDGRQGVITGYRVYLAAGSDVLPGDRMTLRGTTYEIDGAPADWRSPVGSPVGGLVVALKLGTG